MKLLPPPQETKASHILVEKEETAIDLMSQLADGADFTELAKEHSTGPSSSNGGDLGYFTRERMVPAFAEAAFATPVGSLSASPVKTQFGWHIIQVEDRRQADKPELENMRQVLVLQLQEKILEDTLAKLRANSSIDVVDLAEAAAQNQN